MFFLLKNFQLQQVSSFNHNSCSIVAFGKLSITSCSALNLVLRNMDGWAVYFSNSCWELYQSYYVGISCTCLCYSSGIIYINCFHQILIFIHFLEPTMFITTFEFFMTLSNSSSFSNLKHFTNWVYPIRRIILILLYHHRIQMCGNEEI